MPLKMEKEYTLAEGKKNCPDQFDMGASLQPKYHFFDNQKLYQNWDKSRCRGSAGSKILRVQENFCGPF